MHVVLPRRDHKEGKHMPLKSQLALFLLRRYYLSIICTSLIVLREHVVYYVLPYIHITGLITLA